MYVKIYNLDKKYMMLKFEEWLLMMTYQLINFHN